MGSTEDFWWTETPERQESLRRISMGRSTGKKVAFMPPSPDPSAANSILVRSDVKTPIRKVQLSPRRRLSDITNSYSNSDSPIVNTSSTEVAHGQPLLTPAKLSLNNKEEAFVITDIDKSTTKLTDNDANICKSDTENQENASSSKESQVSSGVHVREIITPLQTTECKSSSGSGGSGSRLRLYMKLNPDVSPSALGLNLQINLAQAPSQMIDSNLLYDIEGTGPGGASATAEEQSDSVTSKVPESTGADANLNALPSTIAIRNVEDAKKALRRLRQNKLFFSGLAKLVAHAATYRILSEATQGDGADDGDTKGSANALADDCDVLDNSEENMCEVAEDVAPNELEGSPLGVQLLQRKAHAQAAARWQVQRRLQEHGATLLSPEKSAFSGDVPYIPMTYDDMQRAHERLTAMVSAGLITVQSNCSSPTASACPESRDDKLTFHEEILPILTYNCAESMISQTATPLDDSALVVAGDYEEDTTNAPISTPSQLPCVEAVGASDSSEIHPHVSEKMLPCVSACSEIGNCTDLSVGSICGHVAVLLISMLCLLWHVVQSLGQRTLMLPGNVSEVQSSSPHHARRPNGTPIQGTPIAKAYSAHSK